MLAILLALAATPPQAIDFESWMTAKDYPVEAARRGVAGKIGVSFTVAPDGTKIRCTVTQPTGKPLLDQAVCPILFPRARFLPARDAAGQPVHGVWQSSFSFYPAGIVSPPSPPDVALSVNRLPDGAAQAAGRATFVVSAEGGVESCAVSRSTGIAALDALVCAQAAPAATRTLVRDEWGRAVRAVRGIAVLFVAQPTARP